MLAAAATEEPAAAQDAQAPPASVEVHLQRAERAAGTRWQEAYNFLCPATGQRANKVTDAPLTPRWIFDDVAILGDAGTAVYVLKTTNGNMMIDSSYAEKTQDLVLPSLHQLGIDPASIRYILLGHGHADHFGGAPYFQQHYGTKVAISAADTQLMEQIASRGKVVAPHVDVTLGDGSTLTLGDTTVHAYLIPGHTEGSMGYIFPVHDHGRQRMAALFGGTVLLYGMVPNPHLKEYIASLAHFGKEAREHDVTVELENHILFDGTAGKLQRLQDNPNGPNPFVVGQAAYQNYLRVVSECAQAQLQRRELGLIPSPKPRPN